MEDFDVGEGGAELRIPVDDLLALVDEAFLIEGDENLADGLA